MNFQPSGSGFSLNVSSDRLRAGTTNPEQDPERMLLYERLSICMTFSTSSGRRALTEGLLCPKRRTNAKIIQFEVSTLNAKVQIALFRRRERRCRDLWITFRQPDHSRLFTKLQQRHGASIPKLAFILLTKES
jgi:hypothetical protein